MGSLNLYLGTTRSIISFHEQFMKIFLYNPLKKSLSYLQNTRAEMAYLKAICAKHGHPGNRTLQPFT